MYIRLRFQLNKFILLILLLIELVFQKMKGMSQTMQYSKQKALDALL